MRINIILSAKEMWTLGHEQSPTSSGMWGQRKATVNGFNLGRTYEVVMGIKTWWCRRTQDHCILIQLDRAGPSEQHEVLPKTSCVMLTTLSLQGSEHGLVLWAVTDSSQCRGLECLLIHVILNNEYSFVILRGFFCNSFLFAANI